MIEYVMLALFALAVAGGLYTGWRKLQWPENEMTVPQALVHAGIGVLGLLILVYVTFFQPGAPAAYCWAFIPFVLGALAGAWIFSFRWFGWAFPKWAIVLHALLIATGVGLVVYGMFWG